jgi:hypothetical protein
VVAESAALLDGCQERPGAGAVGVILGSPLGLEGCVEHSLERGTRFVLAAVGQQDLGEEKVSDGAFLIVGQRGSEMSFRLLVAAAE